jgi:microsomal prostaglandin-E synthase 2
MFRYARVLGSAARSRVRQSRPAAPHPSAGLAASAALAASVVSFPLCVVACESVAPSATKPAIVRALPEGLDIRTCKVTLYQFESCPFCRKARAVLDLCNVPYDVVEVNPLTKSETKGFADDYKKVPIVVVEDPLSNTSYQIRDSKIIIGAVIAASPGVAVASNNQSTRLPHPVTLNDETALDAKAYTDLSIDEAWIKWIEGYLLQLVVVNIYGTMSESMETFDYLLTHKDFGWVAKQASYWAGSIVMNQVARARLRKYKHIQGRHRPAFFEACNDLGSAAVAAGGFLGGSRPSPADLNAYGVIRSLEGTKSLREAISGDASPEFKKWYENMNTVVGESKANAKIGTSKRGSK